MQNAARKLTLCRSEIDPPPGGSACPLRSRRDRFLENASQWVRPAATAAPLPAHSHLDCRWTDRKPAPAPGRTFAPFAISLPLMGIGNPLAAVRPPRAPCQSHYPSWGSETRDRERSVQAQAQLITPHGDRKLHVRARGSVPPFSSLPLMGIGNQHERLGCTGKRRRSLPLMGIGNRPSLRASSGAACSHYPSWGSETLGTRKGA